MKLALVVHDLLIPRGAIQRALHMFGFESDVAADYNAMDILLRKQQPALIVIDADLPPPGAEQSIRAARGFNSPDIKLIAILKDSDFARAASLREAGAHETILGGYDAKKLETKLRVLGLIPP